MESKIVMSHLVKLRKEKDLCFLGGKVISDSKLFFLYLREEKGFVFLQGEKLTRTPGCTNLFFSSFAGVKQDLCFFWEKN